MFNGNYNNTEEVALYFNKELLSGRTSLLIIIRNLQKEI